MKLYVCGPMTGRKDMNRPAFKAARERLRKAGFEVVCPVELNRGRETGWNDCMRRDIAALMECWAVATLEGWEKSRGARMEAEIALGLDMKVMDVKWWIEEMKKRTDTACCADALRQGSGQACGAGKKGKK